MAKRIVKSKKEADKEQNDIQRQREEFRLLAGEWYTGHPVVPAVPLRGAEYEEWQSKLDEYVDLFIEAIRLGNVEKEYIDRIPPEMKREIGEAIQKSIPGAAPDLKKKKKVEQEQKKIERAKEKADAKAKEKIKKESPAGLANQGEGAAEDQVPGYADPSEGPTIPPGDLAERQEEIAEEKKTKFEKFKEAMGKTKTGFKNLGKMAATGIKGAVIAQSPFLRNTLLAYEGMRTAFSKENVNAAQPLSAKELIKGTFNRLIGSTDPDDVKGRRDDRIAEAKRQRAEAKNGINTSNTSIVNNNKSFTTNVVKKSINNESTSSSEDSKSNVTTQNNTTNSTSINNQTSLSKAAAAETGAEAGDDDVLGLLKKIEENTRRDGSPEEKKKKSPLETLIENAKKMITGVIAGVTTLLNSLKSVVTGMISAVKSVVSSVGKLLGLGGAKSLGTSAVKGSKAGAKGVTRALPPRDPKTGRFMKATDAAKGAVGKGASGAAGKAATTAAGKSATGTFAKAVGSKAVPVIGTALAVGGGALDAYQTHQAYEAGEITEKERNASYGEAAGGTGGALAGAAAGAAIGSVVPVVGTAIGGIVGGAVGYMGGSKAGSWLGNMFGSDKTKKQIELEKASPVAPTQVVPRLDNASQIISSPPPDKATPVEQAVAATNDSVTKLASSLASINSKSNTVVNGGGGTSVMIRNSARDHDSTFRRYLFDRSVYA